MSGFCMLAMDKWQFPELIKWNIFHAFQFHIAEKHAQNKVNNSGKLHNYLVYTRTDLEKFILRVHPTAKQTRISSSSEKSSMQTLAPLRSSLAEMV